MHRLPRTWALLAAVLLGACDDDAASAPDPAVPAQPGDAGPPPGNPYGFAVWHDDFPAGTSGLHLSPRRAGEWYDRTRRQALEQVIANLQGNCTRAAWQFARELFARVEPDEQDALIEALDRAMQVAHQADVVENVAAAMAHTASPKFAGALLRALEHGKASVRERAMRSLESCGTPEAARAAWPLLPVLGGRAQAAWLRAARRHLGDEAGDYFGQLARDPRYGALRAQLLEEARKLSPAVAVEVFRPFWSNPSPQLRPVLAAMMHRAGEVPGLIAVREILARGSAAEKVSVLSVLQQGCDREPIADDLLRLTADESANVRVMALALVRDMPGEHVATAIETLTEDPSADVRQRALAAMAERGDRGPIEAMIREIATATGTRLTELIATVVAVRDGGVVPAIVERMKKLPTTEWRAYLQALGALQLPEAFPPLRDVFLAEPEVLEDDPDRALTTHDYCALMMLNARGAEQEIVQLFAGLPRADYVRRARMMRVVAGMAVDREDAALAADVFSRLRTVVFDREEIPQLRLLALEMLRRDLRLDDAMRIRRELEDEELPMRLALMDFLFEFF